MESYLRTICYPYPQTYKTELERELTYQRSKSLIFIQLIFTSSVLIYRPFVLEKALPSMDMWITFGITALCLHLATARRFHKQFEYFYNIAVMFLAPYSVVLHEESVIGSWMIYFLCPVYIFFLTGSIKHFLFHSLGQIFSAVYVYKKPSLEMIEKYSPEDFLIRLTGSFIVGQILMIAIMIHLDNSRKVAYEEAALSELRKEESERQRTFLLSFSHELRNLMNSVIGSVDICLLEPLPEKARDILQSAKLCGKILLQEINNILDSGKVDINELEVHKVNLSSRGLLNKVWLVCGDLIKRRGLRGTFTVSKNLPKKLFLDEGRFTQILLNLLGNAIKFTETGNIDIIVEWLDQETVTDESFNPQPFNEDGIFDKKVAVLHLNSDYDCISIGGKIAKRLPRLINIPKGTLRLVVKDSGCGMSQEELQKLFRKFSQVGEKSKKPLGTGLGLFISKYISMKMGGDIRAFSQKDRGTAFVLALPVECSNGSQTSEDFQTGRNTPTPVIAGFSTIHNVPLTFLIVDDEGFNIAVIQKYVSLLQGVTIETAANGAIAVEKYIKLCKEGRTPCVVTMDIYMPEMDGKEATKQIRKFEVENKLKHTIILMISANCSQSELEECINREDIRADGFLKKPVNIEEFNETVSTLYRKYNKP